MRTSVVGLVLFAEVLLARPVVADGPQIREYEDALVIVDGERPALRLTIEGEGTGTRVRVATLYDPFGEPYLAGSEDGRQLPAIDWGVKECHIGDRQAGPYVGDTPYRTFERWVYGASTQNRAEVSLQRAWLDPERGHAVVLETARIVVHPLQYNRRAIDIRVRLVNVGPERVVLPGDETFLVRLDPDRADAGFRTPDNRFQSGSIRSRGSWLSGSSVSPTKMKTVGVAVFSDPSVRGGAPANFTGQRDGIISMEASSTSTTLEPGASTEWSARVFCYSEALPAVAIQDSYQGYLSGRTW